MFLRCFIAEIWELLNPLGYNDKREEKCTADRLTIGCVCSLKCPIPTCPTPKFRVKRLRPLPARWAEIAPEHRQRIAAELRESLVLPAALPAGSSADAVTYHMFCVLCLLLRDDQHVTNARTRLVTRCCNTAGLVMR